MPCLGGGDAPFPLLAVLDDFASAIFVFPVCDAGHLRFPRLRRVPCSGAGDEEDLLGSPHDHVPEGTRR